MSTRILVADQSEARFYDLEMNDTRLKLIRTLTQPDARLHDRDLKSDRPGRVFDRASTSNQRRGATGHHATGGERTPRDHEARLFAQQIAQALEVGEQKNRYDRLIVMAAPAFLGMLRAALPKAVNAAIVAEVPKDLIHEPESAVLAHLP
jgi:protein required for attachment to host cells